MPTKTKQQRRMARKKKKAEYRKRRMQKQKVGPWAPVKMHLFQMPQLIPNDVPKEKRIELLRNIGRDAKSRFEKKYLSIKEWIKSYDPVYLMSFCAIYFTATQEGTDPEVEGSLAFYPYFLEIMQAFALCQERTISSKALMGDAERLLKDIKEIGELMSLKYLDIPENIESGEEDFAYALRRDMIGQTTAVRNWAYPYQMKRVVCSLAELIRKRFEEMHGINPVRLMDMIFALTEERNELLNKHREKLRTFISKTNQIDMIEAYNQAFPENRPISREDIEILWTTAGKDLESFRNMLIIHSDFKLENILSFDFEHALALYGDLEKRDALLKMLNRLSYDFGEIKDINPDYFILDNPVNRRPFINIEDGKYYSAIWGQMMHNAMGILEGLIAEDDEFREDFSQGIKPRYLEDELELLLRRHFPNATIYRGSQWKDPSNASVEYENDFVVLIDTFALVIEAKSGELAPPAKRGAPKRLFKALQELIEEPSIQAHRFIAHLKSSNGVLSFTRRDGGTHVIDCSKIKYYLPLGVTLTELGTISTNLKEIIKAGITEREITELAPSISLTALELIFELLPLESIKLHYLARRREFEDHVDYVGDEMDLLAFYLDNGFNIGKVEYEGKISLMLTLKSKELDPYFIGIHEGVSVKKPECAMTKWWQDILNKLATTRPPCWIEASYVLLNSTEEDQEKFELNYRAIKALVKEGRVAKKHNWVEFYTGPEERKFLIIGYPYRTTERQENRDVIGTIVNSDKAKSTRGVAVIGEYVHCMSYPYSIMAGRADTKLLD